MFTKRISKLVAYLFLFFVILAFESLPAQSMFFDGVKISKKIEISGFNPKTFGFSKDAIILETRVVDQATKPNRGLVLWMTSVVKHSSGWDGSDDSYSCPDESRGSYYSGDAYLSLVDFKDSKILNTIEIPGQEDSDKNGKIIKEDLQIPYAIRPGYAYAVTGFSKPDDEVLPVIMNLDDYTGQGKKLQFVLYDAESCAGVDTLLAGYDDATDKAMIYAVNITREGKTGTTYWPDSLFVEKPISPGHWKYEKDYRGRGGCLDTYSISYNSKLKAFKGALVSTDCANWK